VGSQLPTIIQLLSRWNHGKGTSSRDSRQVGPTSLTCFRLVSVTFQWLTVVQQTRCSTRRCRPVMAFNIAHSV
jgi:hypothetical protein